MLKRTRTANAGLSQERTVVMFGIIGVDLSLSDRSQGHGRSLVELSGAQIVGHCLDPALPALRGSRLLCRYWRGTRGVT
jgi:hypothetical protein